MEIIVGIALHPSPYLLLGRQLLKTRTNIPVSQLVQNLKIKKKDQLSNFGLIEGSVKYWYFVIKIVLTYCEKKCFSDLF